MMHEEERRPEVNRTASKSLAGDYPNLTAMRRRIAARRDLRHVLEGLRDPQFDRFDDQSGQPSAYGMTAAELRQHGDDLRRVGWLEWELHARLVDPRRVAA